MSGDKAFKDMGLAELRAERLYWQQKVDTWPSWDPAYPLICGLLHKCEQWIAVREREQVAA